MVARRLLRFRCRHGFIDRRRIGRAVGINGKRSWLASLRTKEDHTTRCAPAAPALLLFGRRLDVRRLARAFFTYFSSQLLLSYSICMIDSRAR
jgi:hypothetical protein